MDSFLQFGIMASLSNKSLDNVQIIDIARLESFGIVDNEPRILGRSDFLVNVTYSTLMVRDSLLFKQTIIL